MKLWTWQHTYQYPWDTVVQSVYRKYPNPVNSAVLGTDVIERKVDDGRLYSHKLVSSTWGFPDWARRLLGSTTVCYASEWSQLDPQKKELKLVTKNLSFYDNIDVIETITYTPSAADPTHTDVDHSAQVTVRGVPLSSYMEDLLTAKISYNANRGRQALEWVINTVEQEVKDMAQSTDGVLMETRRQLDDLATKTKKNVDDFQNVARKTLDEFANLTSGSTAQSMPKL